jgi:MSHA pilin protein MshC
LFFGQVIFEASRLNIVFGYNKPVAFKFDRIRLTSNRSRVRKLRAHCLNAGFTMVELIVILTVVGILAATALPRFFDRKLFDARAFADQAKSMVRYAQITAVAQNRPVFVRLNGASIALCFNAACTTPVLAPSGSNSGSNVTLAACGNSTTWYCEAIPASVAYLGVPNLASFFFSALGKPYNAADVEPNSTFPAAATQALAITLNGSGLSETIFVERETGYVH